MTRPTVVKMQGRRPRRPDEVFIGRPSRWGNPFLAGYDGTRDEVVDKYLEWIITQPHLMDQLPNLAGKKLLCYCAPLRCHGDVLADLVAMIDEPET